MKTMRSARPRRSSPAVITLLIIGCTACFVSMLYVVRQSLTPHGTVAAETISNNPALEAQVSKIASQFRCVCGGCSGEPLDQCKCEIAQRARQMIRGSVLSGQAMSRTIEIIDSSFGGRIDDSKDLGEDLLHE